MTNIIIYLNENLIHKSEGNAFFIVLNNIHNQIKINLNGLQLAKLLKLVHEYGITS